MTDPLSTMVYFFRNKRKVIPVILILAFSILGTTAIAAITNSFFHDVGRQTSLYETFDTIYYNQSENGSFSEDKLDQKLSNLSHLQTVLKGNWRNIRATTIFGGYPFYVYYFNKDDTQDFTHKMGWSLVEGNLPNEGTNEIALTEQLMTNKHLKVGDEVGNEIDKTEYLRGRYKIVGKLTENNHPGGLGSLTFLSQKPDEAVSTIYYLQAESGYESGLEKDLEKIKDSEPSLVVTTHTSAQIQSNIDFASIKQITTAIMVIVIMVISISIALLNIIFSMQRGNEFGILAALGYSRRFIIYKAFSESLFQTIIGWILGIGLSQLVYTFLNIYIYKPDGITGLTIFEAQTLLYSIPGPLMVLIFSGGTVFWQLLFNDPISIIEKRD